MNTEHFSIEDWVDCTRGVGDAHQLAAMHDHAEHGCARCADLHDSLALAHQIAQRDVDYEPPAATMRLARALFESSRPMSVFAQVAQVAKLLFDSRLVPAPCGVRTAASGPRRLVFTSGNLVVDLQITASSEPGGRVLVGQITSPPELRPRLPGMRVLLQNARHSIAKAAVNQRGEFQMEFENPEKELTLAFVLYNGLTLIPLGTL